MSVELKSRPRLPIKYEWKIRLPFGFPLTSFEDIAWRACELGIDLNQQLSERQTKEPSGNAARTLAKILRPAACIQALIIDQHGWPEQG